MKICVRIASYLCVIYLFIYSFIHSFICGLFNYAFNFLARMSSNASMFSEQSIGKAVEKGGCGLTLNSPISSFT